MQKYVHFKKPCIHFINTTYRTASNIVGVAKERSCTVEGMLNSIQTDKAEISQRMNDLLQSESRLRSELDRALSQPPLNPVIEVCTDMGSIELCNTAEDVEMLDRRDQKQRSMTFPSDELISSSSASPISNQDISARTISISDESFATPTPATPTSVSDPQVRKTPPSRTMSNPDPISPFSRSSIMCGASLMPLFRRFDNDDDDEGDEVTNHLPIQRPRISDDTFVGRSFESVDFRTGFSGHIALNKATRKGLASTGRSAIRMMGDHRGIGPIGRRNRNQNQISDQKSW